MRIFLSSSLVQWTTALGSLLRSVTAKGKCRQGRTFTVLPNDRLDVLKDNAHEQKGVWRFKKLLWSARAESSFAPYAATPPSVKILSAGLHVADPSLISARLEVGGRATVPSLHDQVLFSLQSHLAIWSTVLYIMFPNAVEGKQRRHILSKTSLCGSPGRDG